MLDKLILKDVQLTAANDDNYFVFEDVLLQVLLHFFSGLLLQSIITNKLLFVLKKKGFAVLQSRHRGPQELQI